MICWATTELMAAQPVADAGWKLVKEYTTAPLIPAAPA